MIGIVWLAMTYGTKARSASRNGRTPRKREAEHAPSTNPMTPRATCTAAKNRYWMSWSAPRWNGWPMTSTMFHTCESVRSFANGHRNGFQQDRRAGPGTAPGARHGVPPGLTPSQTRNTTTMASRNVERPPDRRAPRARPGGLGLELEAAFQLADVVLSP